MADGEGCSPAGAERGEDFEIIDRAVVPNGAELQEEGKGKGKGKGKGSAAEEARWAAPIFSLAKKASENLALSYGHALKSAALVGFMSKPVGNDSTAKTKIESLPVTSDLLVIFKGTSLNAQIEKERHIVKLVSATEDSPACLERWGTTNLNTNQERFVKIVKPRDEELSIFLYASVFFLLQGLLNSVQ